MHSKIGRNDPCPCGSGKKYKKCCLGTDNAAARTTAQAPAPAGADYRIPHGLTRPDVVQPGSHPLLHRFEFLMAAVEELVGREQSWFDAAANQFYEYEIEDAPDWVAEEAHDVFLRFLAFDFPHPRTLRSAAGLMLESKAAVLTPQDRRLLEAGLLERSRLMEAKKVRPGVGVEVEDLTSGERFFVHEKLGSRQLRAFDLLFGRLRSLGKRREFDWLVPLLRADRQQWDLVLDEFYEILLEEDPDAYVDDVFTVFLPHLYWISVQNRLRAMQGPELRTTDGERVFFCEAVYDLVDQAAVEKALDGHRSFERNEGDRLSFNWLSGKRRKGPMAGKRISLGRLELEGDRATLHTQSKERLAKGKELLAKVAGESLRHRLDNMQTPENAMATTKGRGGLDSGSGQPGVLTGPEAQALVKGFLDDHYHRWLDESLPVLRDLTPRQAASDPTTRDMIIEVLKDFENSAARDPNPYDFGWVYEELGLDRP